MSTILKPIANKLLACILLCLFSSAAFSQTKATISGKIIDSLTKTPIEFATVALVNAKDTALISYTLTQASGTFKLTGLPAGVPTRLIISSMGYGTSRHTLVFTPGENKDMGAISLNSKALKEVTVKGERTPVVIRNDTLEFAAEAFKTRPNAVVEDLLKLLPGVQVNMDGSILVNGQSVSKLLVDGKRFFGENITMGTKNLDAELVDKIQVYDDREEDPDHQLSAMEVSKIINLKMKSKVKKSTFGKFFAGGGTRDRYEYGGILSTFRDTLQVSLLADGNNLTGTGFSTSDLYGMGGFNRSGGNALYDGTFGGGGDGGIERMRGDAVNINNDYGKKLKTNFLYSYYNYTKDYNSKQLSEQILPTTLLTTQNASIRQLRQRKQSGSTLIDWRPDDGHQLRFTAELDIYPTSSDANTTTNTFNSQNPKLSNLFNKKSSISQVNDFNDNLIYYQKLQKKGASITINQTLQIQNSGSDDYNFNDLESYTAAIPTSLLDRYANSLGKTYRAKVSGTLNYPLGKKFGNEFQLQSRYTEMANQLSTYNKGASGNYDVFLPDQSNNLARRDFLQNVQNTLRYDISKTTTLRVGVNLETQAITNDFHNSIPSVNQNYAALFPILRLTTQHFYADYSEYLDLPAINQLQPVTIQLSQLETLTGNPDLSPTRERRLLLRYNNYNRDKQTYLFIYGSGIVYSNNIVQVATKDANGFISSTYTNKNSGWSAALSFTKQRQFKKLKNWQFNLNTELSPHINQSAFYLNGDQGTQTRYSFTGGQSFDVNYKSIATLSTRYGVTDMITTYKDVNYPSVNTFTHQFTAIGMLNWPQHFIFDMQYQYNYNPQLPMGFSKSANVLNPAITYMFLKQNRAQFKLSGYDLLNQNINVYRTASTNAIVTGESQILRRYFLLTFQYKINSTKTRASSGAIVVPVKR